MKILIEIPDDATVREVIQQFEHLPWKYRLVLEKVPPCRSTRASLPSTKPKRRASSVPTK